MLVVEKTPHATTGIILDTFYSLPLSIGNPLFPEALWGHELYNGGYCHVDYTMPPTANVLVLHTLEAPVDPAASETTQHRAREYHARLCKPVIRGDAASSTLYYSKVEALPYLSSLCLGQPRSTLRVYWGCMRWPTEQLVNEVANGHWIPVEISASFFQAYPVHNQSQQASELPEPAVDRFSTAEQLRKASEVRMQHTGADVVPPQAVMPQQPLTRREALWDQILLALGGEFTPLVGAGNPFLAKRASHPAEAAAAAGGMMGQSAPAQVDAPTDVKGLVEVEADETTNNVSADKQPEFSDAAATAPPKPSEDTRESQPVGAPTVPGPNDDEPPKV
jgi:hypothetical protein